MRVTRKMLAVLAAAVLVVAVCGDDDDDDGAAPGPTDEAATSEPGGETATTPAGTEAAAGEPVVGGTITIGVDAETDRFDPGNGNIGLPARSVHHLVYGSLTAATPDGEWVPYLAESVTPNDDATEWTVTLRPDLVFHDGNPLDAEALKASMDRFRLETLAVDAFSYITAIDVVDDLTVKITLNKSMGVFPQVRSLLSVDLNIGTRPQSQPAVERLHGHHPRPRFRQPAPDVIMNDFELGQENRTNSRSISG